MTSRRRLGVAVIGFGWMGQAHVPTWRGQNEQRMAPDSGTGS